MLYGVMKTRNSYSDNHLVFSNHDAISFRKNKRELTSSGRYHKQAKI